MRKFVVAGVAAGWVTAAFSAGAAEDQFLQYSAQARAYMTYDFGGAPHRSQALPLHYGFRVDSESLQVEERYTGLTDRRLPALVQFDFSADGRRLALINGLPFAGRSLVLKQDGDSSAPAPAQGEPGGFTWFDWGLLIAGLGGVGYIIAEVSKGHDDPDPPANNSGTNAGGTAAGTVTAAVNSVTGTVTGVVNTVTGTVTGVVNAVTGFTGNHSVEGALPFDPVDRTDPSYRKWLDGGTGQMGDLGG